jgi:hypothetical protein
MADLKPIGAYTVEVLRNRCKNRGITGYSKLSKEDLYRLCVLDEPLEQVMASAKPKKTRLTDRECTKSAADAEKCIKILQDMYPELLKEFCKTIEGPASGFIVDSGKTVGIIDKEGEILAVVPPAPPPPPSLFEVIKPTSPSEKKELKAIIKEKKEANQVLSQPDRGELVEQISKGIKLKRASDRELKEIVKEDKTVREQLLDAIRQAPALKKIDKKSIEERLSQISDMKISSPLYQALNVIRQAMAPEDESDDSNSEWL